MKPTTLAFALATILSTQAQADPLQGLTFRDAKGREFTNATVEKVSPFKARILWEDGSARRDIADLPEAIRKLLDFDPEEAKTAIEEDAKKTKARFKASHEAEQKQAALAKSEEISIFVCSVLPDGLLCNPGQTEARSSGPILSGGRVYSVHVRDTSNFVFVRGLPAKHSLIDNSHAYVVAYPDGTYQGTDPITGNPVTLRAWKFVKWGKESDFEQP